MHRSGGKGGEWGTNVQLCRYSRSSAPVSESLIHLKTPQQPGVGDSWAAVSAIPGPERSRPLWPEEHCQGRQSLQPQELEVLESWAVMQSPGNHRSNTCLAVPVVPSIARALQNAMCTLSERESISLARRLQQKSWYSVGCKNRKHSLAVEMSSFFRSLSSSHDFFSVSYLSLPCCSSSLFLLFQSAKSWRIAWCFPLCSNVSSINR